VALPNGLLGAISIIGHDIVSDVRSSELRQQTEVAYH
jgi:hypothetical protein